MIWFTCVLVCEEDVGRDNDIGDAHAQCGDAAAVCVCVRERERRIICQRSCASEDERVSRDYTSELPAEPPGRAAVRRTEIRETR